ncbi:hypothetical protein [Pseudomonas umsongensis]|uniref:hypothetical protein n=2 Tax=Pseudomonas TaxID=286 RepID=UPI001CDC6B8B|nr:hypothetical protein [Pseudomonas umsongensis]
MGEEDERAYRAAQSKKTGYLAEAVEARRQLVHQEMLHRMSSYLPLFFEYRPARLSPSHPSRRDETSGSKTQGRTTYTMLTWMLAIQERKNSLCLDPGLEHTVLASGAALDEIHNPILLDAIIHFGCFDDP